MIQLHKALINVNELNVCFWLQLNGFDNQTTNLVTNSSKTFMGLNTQLFKVC